MTWFKVLTGPSHLWCWCLVERKAAKKDPKAVPLNLRRFLFFKTSAKFLLSPMHTSFYEILLSKLNIRFYTLKYQPSNLFISI